MAVDVDVKERGLDTRDSGRVPTVAGGRCAVLCGLGAWLPPHVVTNRDLAAELDTSDEWIRSRTGIEQRYRVSDGRATSDLAVHAGHRALASAEFKSVDAVIVATTSPDRLCPATAPEVAFRLGLGFVPAFDVSAACGGFMYGLAVACSMVEAGRVTSVLLIGAEAFSTMVNPRDRATSVLFGDGAGAVVIRAGVPGEPGRIGPVDLGSDGANADLLAIPAGGSRRRFAHEPATADLPSSDYFLQMSGQEIFKHALARMTSSSQKVLEEAAWNPSDVDALVAHQANLRIVRMVAEKLGIPSRRCLTNADRVGNTLAASIPILLCSSVDQKKLAPSDRVLLTAFGAGLTWGSAVLEWPDLNTCLDMLP